jgi:anthranilate synthase component 1
MEISPSLPAFTSTYDGGRPQALFTRLVADLETPVSAYMKLGQSLANSFLFESVQGGEQRGRYSIIGLKPDLIWRCRDGKAEINAAAEVEPDNFVPAPLTLPPMSVGLFGYLGYDLVRHMERLPKAPPDVLGLPEAIVIRPTITAIFDNIRDEIILVTPIWTDPKISARAAFEKGRERLETTIAEFEKLLDLPADVDVASLPDGPVESNTTHDEYLKMVAKAKEYILAGDIFQVVPSQRFRRPFTLPPFSLYRALRRTNPSPFLYFLNFSDFAIVGSSPEILVRLRDGVVTIRPIAGTRPRGKTAEEDGRLAAELMADPKERAEHLMLLDLGRNDVGRVAQTGSVHVTDQFFIERYSHVMHIVSNVEGKLRPGADAVDALIGGFPAGTLSGAPKVRAMEIIDELEKEKRGVYAGAVGYFAANGTMDTCIVLRTAVVKDGVMYVQAGGGVVADSDPEAEYQETVNKAKALMAAAEEATREASTSRRGQ